MKLKGKNIVNKILAIGTLDISTKTFLCDKSTNDLTKQN